VPRILSIGLTIPDPNLRYDEENKVWIYTEPDWEKFGRMVRDNVGPKSRERIELRRMAHEGQRWVREAMLRSKALLMAV